MALKRYRAVGTGLVSHPHVRPAFVGWKRVVDGSAEAADFVSPDGHRFRKLPDGELLAENSDLRMSVRHGELEELPVELPKPASKPTKAEV